MSVFVKFVKWLKGEKPPPTLSEIRTNLRILEMRLNRYEKELSLKKRRALKSLRKQLKAGDINLAREHAKEVIILDRDLISIMQLRTKLGSIRSMIERGAIMQDLAKNLMSLVPYMIQISQNVGDVELSRAFMELAKASERMSVGEETLVSSIEELSTETDVEEAADELLRKMAEKEGIPLPKERVRESKISIKDVERILREVSEEIEES
ncbi:MAG: hypothetical protein DRZ80_06595 [Thermoprotei archaeon]|nr:MAG: hypothetical protein DRZ80_06595 [Thermoprotei archaeon]